MALTIQEFEFWESGGGDFDPLHRYDWNEIDNRIRDKITPEIYNFLNGIGKATARPILSEFVGWRYFHKEPNYLSMRACMIMLNEKPSGIPIFANFN